MQEIRINIRFFKYFSKYIGLNSQNDYTILQSNIGEIYLNLKEFKQSKNYFKKSLEINPRQYVAYFNIGKLYFEQNIHGKRNTIQRNPAKFNLMLPFYYQATFMKKNKIIKNPQNIMKNYL
ncbi:hypothetical protein ABPG72_009056 [Tetrahymena utriculariae]